MATPNVSIHTAWTFAPSRLRLRLLSAPLNSNLTESAWDLRTHAQVTGGDALDELCPPSTASRLSSRSRPAWQVPVSTSTSTWVYAASAAANHQRSPNRSSNLLLNAHESTDCRDGDFVAAWQVDWVRRRVGSTRVRVHWLVSYLSSRIVDSGSRTSWRSQRTAAGHW